MEEISWCGYNWIPQERWGQIHPDKKHWWYDKDCVKIDDDNNLILSIRYNPKYFKKLDFTSETGVGLVSCTEKFKHGTFKIVAKLPK